MDREYIEGFDKLVEVLTKYQLDYTSDFFEDSLNSYNLKKECIYKIAWFTNNEYVFDLDFLVYLRNYCENLATLQLDIEEELSQVEAFSIDSRVKQPESRLAKILIYRFDKPEIGKMPIKKCLNDLFGCRVILDITDLYHFHEILSIHFKDNDKVKVTYKYNEVYKAIHVYLHGKNNKYFPWEIQIWNKVDENSNRDSHRKYKQDYLKWPEIVKTIKEGY